MSRKKFQQIVILVSIVSFFGSTAYGAVGMLNGALTREDATTASSEESQLQAQEKGYELVLKREPENQAALKGLVEVRLQMQNAQGAVKPLEKLVQLNPSQQEYKMLLAQVKQQVGRGDR